MHAVEVPLLSKAFCSGDVFAYILQQQPVVVLCQLCYSRMPSGSESYKSTDWQERFNPMQPVHMQ